MGAGYYLEQQMRIDEEEDSIACELREKDTRDAGIKFEESLLNFVNTHLDECMKNGLYLDLCLADCYSACDKIAGKIMAYYKFFNPEHTSGRIHVMEKQYRAEYKTTLALKENPPKEFKIK